MPATRNEATMINLPLKSCGHVSPWFTSLTHLLEGLEVDKALSDVRHRNSIVSNEDDLAKASIDTHQPSGFT